MICLFGLLSCNNYVEQKSDSTTPGFNKNFCGCYVCVDTYVWYDDKIVEVWYDNPDSVNNIKKHKIAADSLLKHIENY